MSHGLRNSSGSARSAMRPALVAGEQPLCERLRKWQIFRPGTKRKTPMPNLSCETLPEGWPAVAQARGHLFGIRHPAMLLERHPFPIRNHIKTERAV